MKKNNQKFKSSVLLFCCSLSTFSLYAAEQNSDVMQQVELLKQQNKLLIDRIKKLEDAQEIQTKKVSKITKEAKSNSLGLSKMIDNTSIEIHGFVKADAIYDIGAKSGDRINYPRIPLDGTAASETEGHTRFHVRESRISIQSKTPTDYGLLKFKVEGDFFAGGTNSPTGSEVISNSSNFRLRQAYGSIGGLLLGQTWSNYTDVKSFPENLDFSNDTGQSFIRQAQIRYTHSFDENFIVSASLENPESDFVDDTGAVRANQKDTMPDLTARVMYKDDWGHVSTQGVLRELSVDDGSNEDAALGYGIGISGNINTFGKDRLRFHFSYGEGIGRYLQEASNTSAMVFNPGTSSVNIEPQTAYGGYLGYQHWWLPNLRSNFNVGYLKIDWDNPLVVGASDTRNTEFKSVHTNLIWSVSRRLDLGIEYSKATRKQENGEDGDISRVQFSGKFKF